jgi:hypothetical protein
MHSMLDNAQVGNLRAAETSLHLLNLFDVLSHGTCVWSWNLELVIWFMSVLVCEPRT